jgi:hypothetical protein
MVNQSPDNIARAKAKAVYFALLSVEREIVRDVIESTKIYCDSEEAKSLKIEFSSGTDKIVFGDLLEKEIRTILCLYSTKEAYERFFPDKQERERFTATLLYLFRKDLGIPSENFDFYVDGGKRLKNTDKLDIVYMKFFISRIVAFLAKDFEELYSFDWKDGTKFCPNYYLRYTCLAEALTVYGSLFARIFRTIIEILKMYASEDADTAQVIELSRKLDEGTPEEFEKELEKTHAYIMNRLSVSLRRYSGSAASVVNDAYSSSSVLEPVKKYYEAVASKSGTAEDVIPCGQGEFGLEVTNPVPVCGISGSFSYLSRLRTENGDAIEFERIGSTLTPGIEHPIDIYKIMLNNAEIAVIYISPYHKKTSEKASRGFKLVSDSKGDDKRQSFATPKKPSKESFLKRLLSIFRKRTLFDDVKELSKKVIVSGYRRIALLHGCAPTEKTSNEKIIEIYSKVCTAFQQAAKQRGTRIPALNLNFIVLKFLQVYETMGDVAFDSHLKYEIGKYISEGLRPEYNQELRLF